MAFVGVIWGGGGPGGGRGGVGGVGGGLLYIYIVYIYGLDRVQNLGPKFGVKNWSSFDSQNCQVSKTFCSRFDKRQSCHVDDKSFVDYTKTFVRR